MHYPVANNFLLEYLKGNIPHINLQFKKVTNFNADTDTLTLKETTKILTQTWAHNDQWLEKLNTQTDTSQ